jgi:hypothetical protein
MQALHADPHMSMLRLTAAAESANHPGLSSLYQILSNCEEELQGRSYEAVFNILSSFFFGTRFVNFLAMSSVVVNEYKGLKVLLSLACIRVRYPPSALG